MDIAVIGDEAVVIHTAVIGARAAVQKVLNTLFGAD